MAKWLSRRPVKLFYARQMEIAGSKKDIYYRLIYSQVDSLLRLRRSCKEKQRNPLFSQEKHVVKMAHLFAEVSLERLPKEEI